MALIDRAREIIAAEDDDFFLDDTIVYYINKGQHKVASYMISFEKRNGLSLRSLDNLRAISELTLSAGTSKDSYFQVDEDFPSDLKDFNSLVYNDKTVLNEIGQKKRFQLELSNLIPSSRESYFIVINDGTNKQFRLYLYENPDGATDTLEVSYVKEPTDIVAADDSFSEIPTHLENAVLYAAASMMASQELSEGTQLYEQKYQEEIQANIY